MPPDSTKGSTETKRTAEFVSHGRRLCNLLQDRFTDSRNEKVNRAVLFLLTSLILTFLIVPNQHFQVVRYTAGDIAPTDIKATQSYLLEDRALTDKKKAEAAQSSPVFYDYRIGMGEELKKRFARAFSLIIDARNQGSEDRAALLESVSAALECTVTVQELAALERIRNFRVLLGEVGHVSDTVYRNKVVANKAELISNSRHGILLFESESGRMIGAGDATVNAIDLRGAADLVRGIRLAMTDRKEAGVIRGLIEKALKPNLSINNDATERKRREARDSVRPVVYQIKRGEMIVREGERISEEQALKLNKIFELGRGVNRFLMGVGIFGLILVLFSFPYRFGQKNIRKFHPSSKDLLLLALVTIGFFLLLKIAHVISTAMGILFPWIGIQDYFYLLPFAAGAMLVRIILNSEVALVYCAVCAPLLGIMFDNSLPVVIYSLLGGIIGAHGVRQCQYRGTIYTAGLKVSVVNLALAVPFQVLTDNLFTSQSLYIMIFALLGGVINAVIVAGTVPVIENLFHYTTDIKLLELASLNSPVLRELMIRAPGTYHHSILVGTMVEAAAEAIHANPLLARVAAYYHDIGKASKPLYFIENVRGGENRHDKLSPSMSALILIAHVKEGVELAKERRLGLPIIDVIRQHHGTALISYFFQKAKGSDDSGAGNVDERDFRYPGPKPQTREAGLVMLADCVEAASKTLTDPTPARIQGMVQKIINNIFIDGQLDECELTLKNLHDIAKSFNRILSGIYHHRIDYPEPAFKVNGRKKAVEDSDREQAKTASHRGEEGKKTGGEDLKRLGIHR
jgi:putative nucleotidyltransferase with HDIG domain